MNVIQKTGMLVTLSALTAINLAGYYPNILTGGKALASNVPSKTFRFNPVYRGDCQMHNATLTFNRDGTGQFNSKVLTLHTHSGDNWRVHFIVKNQAGAELFQLGEWKGPRMSDGNPPPAYDFNQGFVYNQSNFDALGKISINATC